MPRASSRDRRTPVCIVRHNYYPDTHVRRDAEALVQAGYDVSVVALRRPNQPARETLNGVDVHRMPVGHRRGSALRYAWEYAAFAILAFLQVTLLHLRKRFRIVEVDNMPDPLVFTALVPKLTGARVLFYIFDNMPELLMVTRRFSERHPAVRLLAFLERISAAFADRVVVTQETARRVLQARGVPADKLVVVLNCPDEGVFVPEPPRRKERRDGAFELVTHGAILERYGVQVLIEALPAIAARVPEARLQVFGEGEHRRELEALAERKGVAHLVRFRGLVPIDELIANLRRADAGYAGMLCDNMLSNKLVEYVALGVPAVVARWSTFEHYFSDDAVAYFRPGEADDLARAIVAVHREPELARVRAERASELYRFYRWPVQRELYLGVYADLVAPGAAAAPVAGIGAAGLRRSVSGKPTTLRG
ncbi:MAG TPA: glycosyltransferase family 4 protein [Chloroflexota bacterium]|nr:glycosyltransferase family 4 protein [Chloroflexota bacterium]